MTYVAEQTPSGTASYTESRSVGLNSSDQLVTYFTETTVAGGSVTATEYTTVTPGGDYVTYLTEVTPSGQTETLVETVAYTPSGQSYTKVQGTATNGEFISYTEAPTPYTYVEENGNTVTFSYVPTSYGGWSTVTYVTKKTPSGYITYVDMPTPSGVSTYSESVQTIQTSHGTATETVETLSNGSVVTYVTATGTIEGQPVTYVEEITPSGTSEFIERTYITSNNGVATYVCGSNSEGASV